MPAEPGQTSLPPSLLPVSGAVIRIAGIFEVGDRGGTLGRLAKAGFSPEEIPDNLGSLLREIFYPEFVATMFPPHRQAVLKGPADRVRVRSGAAAEVMVREFQPPLRLELLKGREPAQQLIPCGIDRAEALLFPEPGLGLFALHLVAPAGCTLGWISEVTSQLQGFRAQVRIEGVQAQSEEFVQFIERQILGGVKLRGPEVEIDEYAGAKFKVFSVVQLADECPAERRRELLYDLGCGVPLGAAAARTDPGSHTFAPSMEYYRKLMDGTVNPFANYDMLPLVDSCTVVGSRLFRGPHDIPTWGTTYFRIYLFNLFLKFSLHHYAAKLNDDLEVSPVDLRDRFERFLRYYDIGRISFKFLPELLHRGIRSAMDIQDELARFRDRITRLSVRINETNAKRTNQLLAMLSWAGSLTGLGVIWSKLELLRQAIGLPLLTFAVLLLVLGSAVGIVVLNYLFPDKNLIRRFWHGTGLLWLRLRGQRPRLHGPAKKRIW